ncbi:MAG: hypothetical protein ACUVQY_10185 [Thermoproteota archaeon]
MGKGSKHPYNRIVRGILAGFSLLFRKEAKAAETICIGGAAREKQNLCK